MAFSFSARPNARQTQPVGAERIGLENLGAGLDVLLMDSANQVGAERFSSSKQRLMKTPWA